MKKYLFVVILFVVVLLSYYLGTQNADVNTIQSQKVDYSNIDTSESISWNLIDADIVEHDREIEPTEEIKTLLYNYVCSNSEYSCNEEDRTVETQLSSVDLNEDGVNEYIAMPSNVSSVFMRGASGNGDIYLLQENSDSRLEVIASLFGNSYIVLNSKLNGYYKIYTHSHINAASGTETIYAKEVEGFGTEEHEYVRQFTKWYRQYKY